ncbi:multidrug ABC transporter ATPase [Methylobacterium sp. sgz302541]|uniref:multidrug ABC transporter ATPase n=1 Tax=unclassified Methylobacterium TaxID=2615210 RepID=UPI003D34FD32
MDTINFLHALFHSIAGTDYPVDHWWLDLGAGLMLVVAPFWSAWILGRFILRRTQEWWGRISATGLGRPTARWPLEMFVLRTTLRYQVRVAILCLLTLPAAWLLLEIPKHIINHALADSVWRGDTALPFLGLELRRLELLLALCASYLAVLTFNGLIKYATNHVRGLANERLVRRLRLAVVRRARHVQSEAERATLAAVAVQEVEAIGYFGGGLVAVPLLQGGAFLISIAFLLLQNAALAVAALVMLPVQLTLLPRLQRRLNATVRERVHATHALGAMLTAPYTKALPAVLCSNPEGRERSPLRSRIHQAEVLERLRIAINELKSRMKGLYNYTSNLTPFFLFLIGGYLIVEGQAVVSCGVV